MNLDRKFLISIYIYHNVRSFQNKFEFFKSQKHTRNKQSKINKLINADLTPAHAIFLLEKKSNKDEKRISLFYDPVSMTIA